MGGGNMIGGYILMNGGNMMGRMGMRMRGKVMGGMGVGENMMGGIWMSEKMMGGMSMSRNMMDGMRMRHDIPFGNYHEKKNEKVKYFAFLTCLSPPSLNYLLYLMIQSPLWTVFDGVVHG